MQEKKNSWTADFTDCKNGLRDKEHTVFSQKLGSSLVERKELESCYNAYKQIGIGVVAASSFSEKEVASHEFSITRGCRCPKKGRGNRVQDGAVMCGM